ncbi:MAG: BamA/TamA family outer membrane protein, partial [Bacteroidota bacterium]|nr:BamA/TamA family outer membrane protein [Bacteroidota bacterium]
IEIKMIKEESQYIDLFDGNLGATWDPEKNTNIKYSLDTVDASGVPLPDDEKTNAFVDKISRRIDYIFLGSHFSTSDVKEKNIIFDEPINNTMVSDHYGVFAEIGISRMVKESPDKSATGQTNESKTEYLPIASYDTDAGFGYGAKAFFLNTLNHNESFDLVLFNSTKGERWYRALFSYPDFELRQGKIYPMAFDLLVDYDKWIKNSFFGIGNFSRFDNREYYSREPIEITLTFSRGWSQHSIGSIALRLRSIRNFNYSDTSALLTLSSSLNTETAKTFGIVLSYRYDSRNSYVNPSRGFVLLSEFEYAPKIAFANVDYQRIGLWFQNYTTLFYPTTIFATRIGVQQVNGNNLPIQVLLPIGGNQTLRGSPQDRFLDKASALINLELRFPLVGRLGAITGLDAGKVWQSLSSVDLKRWQSNPTFGLRFFMDTFVVRLDVGLGKETTGFYLNFGHLF